jgi:hypothetical protein
MNVWRIKEGIPSLADALLVVGGLIGICMLFLPFADALLDFLEPKGLAYLGYFIALMFLLGAAAAGVWAFLKNEKKMRWEVVIPRRIFAITAAPLIFIAMHLTSPWAWRSDIGFFEHVGVLVLLFLPLFVVVMRLSLRFPRRAAEVALWFHLSLAGIGVLAKAAGLLLKK